MAHTVIARAKRAEESAPKKGSSITLTAHGDGTYHTAPNSYGGDEGRVDHASIGAALMHIASQHSDGDHMHVHGTDNGYTTHSVKEGGKVEGPKEHKTIGAVKKELAARMAGQGEADAD